MVGRVVSVKNAKTAVVLVERIASHPLYKKTYAQSKKYLVDDSFGVKEGDIVDFVSCRPISKRKCWKIIKVLGKDFAEIAEASLKKGAEEAITEVMPEEKENKETPVVSSQTKNKTEKKQIKPSKRKEKSESLKL